MEDNEEEILCRELGIDSVEPLTDLPAAHLDLSIDPYRIHPALYRAFIAGSAGMTVLIDRLLDGVAAGRFPPTDSPGDCRYCDFRPICRVPDKLSAEEEPPLLHWASAHWAEAEAFTELRAARTWEGA
jgi:hypothetical protein